MKDEDYDLQRQKCAVERIDVQQRQRSHMADMSVTWRSTVNDYIVSIAYQHAGIMSARKTVRISFEPTTMISRNSIERREKSRT